MEGYILIVFYHHPCSDGMCCAHLINLCYADVTYVPCGNLRVVPKDEVIYNQDVLVLDYSFSKETLVKMASIAKSVTVLDHHASASYIEELLADGIIEGEFDIRKSGARLTLDWLRNQGYEIDLWDRALVDYIEDYDLWKFALPNSKEVNATIQSYPMDLESWKHMPNVDALVAEGKAILRYKESLIKEHLDQVFMGNLDGVGVPTVVCTSKTLISELGNRMAQNNPYAVIKKPLLNGTEYSLRSSESGEDVSEIAKRFGGGGHKHAAGFVVLNTKE